MKNLLFLPFILLFVLCIRGTCQSQNESVFNTSSDTSRNIELSVQETQLVLRQTQQRLHILEGLIIARVRIDDMIDLTKNSKTIENYESELKKQFGLSTIQADTISNLSLQELVSLDVEKTRQELDVLIKLQDQLNVNLSKLESEKAKQKEELNRITVTFNNVTALEIIEQLKKETGLDFYYQSKDLPKRAYTLTFNQATLEEVLDQVFENTLASYTLYRDYAVLIFPSRILDQLYSAEYYEVLDNSLDEDSNSSNSDQFIVGDISELNTDGNAIVQGYLIDSQTKEEIIGATVSWTQIGNATISDENGRFEIEVPAGRHEILIKYIGYNDLNKTLDVQSSGSLTLEINKAAISLDEVLIQADAPDASVKESQISVTRLDIKAIKKLPSFLGEADVVKSLLLNPGVSSIGEGATGFNVRGGEVDQNLLMQDEGFFFNSSHALGFFSTFNADLLSSVELYKGNIPAQYGGRLASVMKVDLRSGDFENFKANGGIGPVSGRINFEGPIQKNKSSFLIGLRSSYSDWILKNIDVLEVKNSSSFFIDANMKLTFRLNEKNTLIFSGYASEDEFVYNQEFGFDYSTVMGQMSYRKIFSQNVFSNFSFTFNKYNSVQTDLKGFDAAILSNDISYYKIKEQLTLIPSESLKVDAGFSSILYQVQPGEQSPYGTESTIVPQSLSNEKGLESAVFANSEWSVSDRLQITLGVRLAFYQYLGAKTAYEYQDPQHPTEVSITGIRTYDNNEIIESVMNMEPRISFRYSLLESSSIKAGYSRTSQFINQIFNSDSPTPTSQWQLSTDYIKPHLSHNFSLGYFQNFENNNWETSAEVYYRKIDRLYDYKDFAVLTVNDHIETELLEGIGRSYGFELSIKKKLGLINGWISYTRSNSERQINGINFNNWYPSNFDKPHDFSLVVNYSPNQRHTVTFNFNYGTGRPTTPPVGNFQSDNGLVVPVYTERNQLRIPDYHRLDVAYAIGQGYKKNRKFKTSWIFSIYNVYGRKNAYSVFFTQGAFQQARANKLSVLGSAFPAISFNFQFL